MNANRLILVLTTLACLWFFSRLAAAASAAKPNFLLICVDDLKPLLGCYGDKRIKSPNLDRLAKRGLLFERAYCNQAVCAPSRNAPMTGARSTTLGIYDLGTNFRQAIPDAVTLSQVFKQNGYRTEALGKSFTSVMATTKTRRRGACHISPRIPSPTWCQRAAPKLD